MVSFDDLAAGSDIHIVVPLTGANGELVGVFDLDSPVPARFSVEDQEGLEAIARVYLESLQ